MHQHQEASSRPEAHCAAHIQVSAVAVQRRAYTLPKRVRMPALLAKRKAAKTHHIDQVLRSNPPACLNVEMPAPSSCPRATLPCTCKCLLRRIAELYSVVRKHYSTPRHTGYRTITCPGSCMERPSRAASAARCGAHPTRADSSGCSTWAQSRTPAADPTARACR
jgi:hypothetical protein